MGNQETFLADKPISEEKDDKFQRYNFSKRIAETILNRNSRDSIVIGVYGAWGEGKTSVLNFIKQELRPHYPNVIHFTFNPWRFTDEAALLTSFFNTLATELRNSFPKTEDENYFSKKGKAIQEWWKEKKGPLKTSKETVGEIIEQYGKIVSIFGAGEIAETIGKAISNVDIEKLKERIEKLLEENKKRIVIFIDDIDRLEKNEIHSIFRLVKLTGDFAYTTYVLSFDENMVSAAIGERFGTGDQKAGMNFLEKIIQIPIKIPLAQKSSLKNYCFKLIEKALDASQITLPESEAQDFVSKFTSNILIRLNTPRLAVRYGNTLSFSLPLLKGEVNTVDLLLIEAVRVFYPELYEFIRTQPDYFIGTYKDTYSSNIKNEKIETFKTMFADRCKNYNTDERADAKGILSDLFPNLGQVWGSGWSWGHGDGERQYNEKRISSSHYLNRYFSFTVIEGDISDIAFNELIDIIKGGDHSEKLERTIALIKSATPDNFIQKIRFREKSFDSSTATNLAKVFSQLGDFFPKKGNNFLGFTTPFSQAAIFIAQLIRNQIEDAQKFEMVKWAIENAKPFQFAYEIFNFCRSDKNESKKLFTDEQYIELTGEMIKRAKALSGQKPIWTDFNHESRYMLNVWAHDFDKFDLHNYVKQHLDVNSADTINLIKVFTPFIHSTAHPTPYYGDFEKNHYDWLKQVLDKDFIYEKVCGILGSSPATVDKYEHLEHKQTDDNLLRQFIYWYNKDKSDTVIQDAEIITN